MPPAKTVYKCKECGNVQAKWAGQCSKCKEWNTLQETDNIQNPTNSGTTGKGIRASKTATNKKAQPVNKITADNGTFERINTGINEVNRVLGGGLVPGGVILLAGQPGSGKSTITLTIALSIANTGKKVLYITGEETEGQVAARAERINPPNNTLAMQNLYLLSEGNLQNSIEELLDIQPDFFIVDSIQTLISNDSESRSGSVTQVHEVATDFTNLAKKLNVPAILIGQVLKDTSQIAGPKQVEHLVDAVLMFEASENSSLRLLRAKKNRYSGTDEIGIFQHTSEGIEAVDDPSGFFTSPHAEGVSGFANSITLEGIRALPIEITALVTKTKLPNPRKITSGIEHGRALQMQAVVDRYIRLNLDSQDVYVATTGGLKLKDASTDLAALAAIVSSAVDIPIPSSYIFIGEVSLTGEVRAPREHIKRIKEATRLGFDTIYTPPIKQEFLNDKKINIIQVSTVHEMCLSLKNLKPDNG